MQDYPWLDEYKVCGIPATLEPYPDVPSHFFLDRAAKEFPRMGCVQMGLQMRYSEVKEHADRLATALVGMGVHKGDRVATLLPSSIQFVIADAAISKAGAVHVPGSFIESQDNLAKKFSECTPKVLIGLDEHVQTALGLTAHMQDPHVIITKLDDYSGAPSARKNLGGALWLGDVIDQTKPNLPAIAFDSTCDLETLLFTGGTTGVAKGCMLTHKNIVANALQNEAMFGPIIKILRGNTAVLMGLPFFHAFGHCLMHTMMSVSATLILIVDPRDTKHMLAMIKEHHPVFQVGVPTQFMNMLGEDLKKAKLIGISGSAALPPTVQEKFEQSSGGYITEGYGLSELTSVTHYNVSANIRVYGGRDMMRLTNLLAFNALSVACIRIGARIVGYKWVGFIFTNLVAVLGKMSHYMKNAKASEKRATIGIPVPDTELRIVDVDSGKPLTFDELSREGRMGEMCIKGPQRMLGYWPESGKGLDPDGYVRTGDVVKMDDKGYFSIADRTKDMVIVSGFKVYTREIDDLLYDHPATACAATIGIPDPDRPGSERVQVFIQIKEDYQGKVSEDEYLQFIKAKVAKYAVPRGVAFLDEIPLTSVFKVNKKALREMALEMLGT